jgi:hypothetical protein
MMDLLFADGAPWFAVPALIGTGVFVIRLVLMLMGGIAADMDVSLDAHDLAHHGDSTHAFQVISIQSVSAMMMGFGWAGLASLKGMGWSWPVSILVATACGVAMVYLLAITLKAVYDLQSHGNINIADTVGVEGDVYIGVPASGGTGKVRLVVENRQRIYNAIAHEAIPTSTRVRVVSVNADNTVTVARA